MIYGASLGRLLLIAVLIVSSWPRLGTAQTASEVAQRASEAMQAGDYAEAERQFTSLKTMSPGIAEVYSNLGLAQYYNQNSASARQSFQKALTLKPGLFVPNFYLARIQCEAGNLKEALPLLQKAVKAMPQETESRTLLAEVLARTGAKAEAGIQYRAILKQNPNDAGALYSLVRLYLDLAGESSAKLRTTDTNFTNLLNAETHASLQDWDAAVLKDWTDTFAKVKTIPGLRIPFADFLMTTKRLAQADEVLHDELQLDPFSYSAMYRSAELALLKGDVPAAIDFLNRSASIRPEYYQRFPTMLSLTENLDDLSAKAVTANESFGKAFVLMELARQKNDSAEVAKWEELAKKNRDQLNAKVTRQVRSAKAPAISSRVQGLKLLREKRLEDGVRLLMPLTKGKTEDASLTIVVARALFELQRPQELTDLLSSVSPKDGETLYFLVGGYRILASQSMDSLAKVDPQSAGLMKLMAESMADRQLYKKAEEIYRDAIAIHPEDAELHFGLGEAYFNQMQFAEANLEYAKAIERNPQEPSYYVMAASALVELQKPDEAIALSKKALELDPTVLTAHVSLGRALSLIGRDEEAASEFEKATSTDSDGMLHYKLFRLYLKLGRKEDAQRALKVSKDLRSRMPGSPENASQTPAELDQ